MEGEEVYEKAREIIEEGRARCSLTLEGFQKKVEVGAGSTWRRSQAGAPSLRRVGAANSS